jgi:hypothetical protein
MASTWEDAVCHAKANDSRPPSRVHEPCRTKGGKRRFEAGRVMTPYKDVSGKSGVDSYEIRGNSILVRFKRSSKIYVYDYDTPGKENVDEMKRLAKNGKDLATYISQVVKRRYSRKL